MIDQILLNATDNIEIDIYYNGALSAATNVVISSLKNPDGTVLATNLATTAGSTTGRYICSISSAYTSALGIYTAIWQFTISSTVYEHTQSFEVVSALRSGYVSPQEVRNISAYSKITASSPTDAVLQKYINIASNIIDSYLGGSVLYSTYSETVRCALDKPNGGILMQFKHTPIDTVTSVTIETIPSSTVDLTVANLKISKNTGQVQYYYSFVEPYSLCLVNPVGENIVPTAEVVYTAGFTSLPDDLQLAACLLVENIFKETEGEDKLLSRITVGDYTEQYTIRSGRENAKNVIGDGSWITIKKILDKYRQPNQSARFIGILG